MPKLYGKITVKRLAGVVKIVPGGSGAGGGTMQEKTVSPSTAAQTVTPDGGFSGLSRVYLEAVALQDKSVKPGTAAQAVAPDEGYLGLGQVLVGAAPLQNKTIQASKETQAAGPDAGFYGLSHVIVEPAAANKAAEITVKGDVYTVTLADGTLVEGIVEFDANGMPTDILDSNGTRVEFDSGMPVSATHSDGHTVTIL